MKRIVIVALMAVFTVAGLLGSTFVPKFIGNISSGGASVQESLLIAAVMAGILFVIAFFSEKSKTKRTG